MICLTLLLPSFVDIATIDEKWLKLSNNSRRYEDEVEDGEESQLQVVQTVSYLPEGEAVQ